MDYQPVCVRWVVLLCSGNHVTPAIFKSVRQLILLCIVCLACFSASAQKQYHNWYFGINTGMRFTDTGIAVIKNSLCYAQEGAASISDSAGNLLFYGGRYVRNRNHGRFTNDTLLGYDGTTEQQFLIVPKPGDPNIYYYFNNNNYTGQWHKRSLKLNVVDMRLNGGLGDFVSINDTLMLNTTEQLTATRHSNGEDIWVVTHSFANDEFHSFLVTKNGVVKNPVISRAGIYMNNFATRYAGNIKISQNGCWLISTIREAYQGGGAVQLLHFDNTTGIVSGNTVRKYLTPWGVEFSHDSRYAYLGFNRKCPMVQFDLEAGSDSMILATGTNCSDSMTSWDLQLGPDNRIYFCGVDDGFTPPWPKFIGVINNPTMPGLASDIAINYKDTFYHIIAGLPNNFNLLSKQYKTCERCKTLVVSKETKTICNGDSLHFGTRYLKVPGTYQGDTAKNDMLCDTLTILTLAVNQSDSALSHSICQGDSFHFFDTTVTKAGMYSHHLKSYNGCDSLVTLTLVVKPAPSPPLLRDTAICSWDSLVVDVSGKHFQQVWLNGVQVSQRVVLKAQGMAYLKFSDSAGCLVQDSINVEAEDCDTIAPRLKIPNVFTPGTDNYNDRFDIDIEGEQEYSLYIYNRWGLLVFRQDEDAEPSGTGNWNGRVFNTGSECPGGTYYYLFDYAFKHGGRQHTGGVVTLIR